MNKDKIKNEDIISEKGDIEIIIDGEKKICKYRTFKSLKKGWGSYGVIKIKGYPCRLSLNIIEM